VVFLLPTSSRPALGPTQPPNQWVTRASSLGVMWQGRETKHSYPHIPELYLHSLIRLYDVMFHQLRTGTNLPLPVLLLLFLIICRSQWPRGLRYEMFSLARTLGSWVRIPLKPWMSVCAFILCLCCSVCR
jgi:hypothetical protein